MYKYRQEQIRWYKAF